MKKKCENFFTMIFVLVLFISNIYFLPINASTYPTPDGPKIPGSSATIEWTNFDGLWSSAWWGDGIPKISVAGETAFCIEPTTLGLNGPYHENEADWNQVTKNALSRIVYYGWEESPKTDNDYLATQFMVWEYIGAKVNLTGAYSALYPSMKTNIQARINTHGTKPSFDGGTYEINVGESISLEDSNHVLNKFHVYSNGGADVKIKDNTLLITPDYSTPDDSNITLWRIKSDCLGSTLVYRSTAHDGQDVGVFKVSDPLPTNITIKVKKFGSLKLAKQDEDGVYVPNTTFKLSYHDDMSTPIGSYTTGLDGTIMVNDLQPQTIYIQEAAVPSHLLLDDTVYAMTVKANDTVSYMARNNWIKGKVQLKKTDSELGSQVSGATYAIYDDKGQELQRLVTTATGFVESGYLRFGNYTVKEVIAPVGYVLNDTIYPVNISSSEQRIQVMGIDRPIKSYLQVEKKDLDTGKSIQKENAYFSIYQKDGTYVQDIKTNAKGMARSDLLRYGEYYLVEKTAPEGYVQSNQKIQYQLLEDGKTYTAVLENKRVTAGIELLKEDSITGKLAQGEATLQGAIYGLYARDTIEDPADGTVKYPRDSLVMEVTTNQEAKASVSNLYLGKYYLKEIKASAGYTLDPNIYPIDLTYQGQTNAEVRKQQTVKEKVISQAFSLIKVSDHGSGEADLLKGVEFTIKSQQDIEKAGGWEKAAIAKNAQGEQAAVMITDAKGYASSEELPYGTYVVRETKTPADLYRIPDFMVVIDQDSREPQPWRVFNDEKFKAVVAIVKQDAETKNTIALPGAVFKIRNLDTNRYVGSWVWNPLPHYVDSWVSDASGCVMTENVLKPGRYQLEEMKAPVGYLHNNEPIPFQVGMNTAYETLPDGTTPVISVHMMDTSVKGKIKVMKEGEVLVSAEGDDGAIHFVYEKRKQKDAVFELYAKEEIYSADHQGVLIYQKDELVDSIRSGNDGIAESKELPLGVYYVKEKVAPYGFTQSDEIKEIVLSYEGQLTPLVFGDAGIWENDRQKMLIQLVKQDGETKQPIAGAEFSLFAKKDIYQADGKLIVKAETKVSSVKTDDHGYAVFSLDLPLEVSKEVMSGWKNGEEKALNASEELFYLMETQAAPGYKPSDGTRYDIDARYTSQDEPILVFEYSFYNQKSEVEIEKIDADGKALAGNELMIADAHGKVVEQWITTDQPHIVKGLHIGEPYLLQEKTAAAGYTTAMAQSFVVTGAQDRQVITMVNRKTMISIVKVDQNTGDLLQNAELAIYDDQGIEVDRWMSSNEPHVVYGLSEGQSYSLIEIAGPVGYVLMEECSFLAQDGITVTAYNQKARRDLVFTKVDADDETNVLADAEFALYDDADCQHELQRQQSDGNGMVRFTALTYGTYYLKELRAPHGYQLDPEKRVMVLDDAEQQEMSWSNKRKQTVLVQSGDLTNPEAWLLVSACSAGLIFLLFMRKKRNNG